MFFGAVPRQAITQVCNAVAFHEWGDVFVGCSGSFRFDRAVHDAYPSVRVHSNDVSLVSCAIGELAAGGELAVRFINRLAFIEDHLRGQAPHVRVAAIWVAQEMAKYRGANSYAQAHFAHYQQRFPEFLWPAAEKMAEFLGQLCVASFHGGDFRDQAARALEAGGGVAAFPPTYKGDYERLYRFIDANVEWPHPTYRLWNPAEVEGWLDELKAMGVRYCVLVEHKLERHQPATAFFGKTKPVYTYTDQGGSSVRRLAREAEPFRYTALNADDLRPDARVEIVPASARQMNFLKDIYLAKEIQHTQGIANFLVFLDGKLAGGFIYVKRSSGWPGLYVLCDFSLCPKSRVSKLIVMLATCSLLIERMEVLIMARIERVYTTAYTNKPVSMKYRGLYDLERRDPGKLIYASSVRHQSPTAIYADWWQRFIANGRHPASPVRAALAGEKRPLHEGAAV